MKQALAWLALASCAFAQQNGNANTHYQTEEQRNDIASGLTAPDRDKTQRPAELVASLPIRPGMTVADIGTGAGYMLPYLSRAVGAEGHVIAEDVFPDMLSRAAKHASAEKLANVSPLLGTGEDAKLPAAGVDVAFLLEVYHHVDHPARLLASLRQGLKGSGTLVIVDFYKRKDAMPGGNAEQHIRADQAEVIQEIESNGFHLSEKRDHIDGRQYVLVFRKA